mgnify:CR=1 FL=1
MKGRVDCVPYILSIQKKVNEKSRGMKIYFLGFIKLFLCVMWEVSFVKGEIVLLDSPWRLTMFLS